MKKWLIFFLLFPALVFAGPPTAPQPPASGIVVDAINDSATTTAPSQNAVFDALALKQELDTDLTYLAGFTPTANVKSILNAADYAAIKTLMNLTIGTDVQAYDADLTTYAGITPSANMQTLLGIATIPSAVLDFIDTGVLNNIKTALNNAASVPSTSIIGEMFQDNDELVGYQMYLATATDTLVPATPFLVPAADPDVATSGRLAIDTDSANEAADVSLRASDGSNQYLVERKIKCFGGTMYKPQDMVDAQRDLFPIWSNNTGMIFTITEIKAWSDTDDTDFNVEVVTSTNFSSPSLVDAIQTATDGTSVYTDTETTISDATIAHDEIVTLDFDDTDNPGYVMIQICGWFNADVN